MLDLVEIATCGILGAIAGSTVTGIWRKYGKRRYPRAVVTPSLPVSFADYDKFVRAMWIYDPEGHGMMPELGYLGLCLAGEAGELAEKLKKVYRDTGGKISDVRPIMLELGDITYYCNRLAQLLGDYDLQDVVEMNVDKLRSRAERGTLRGSGDDR